MNILYIGPYRQNNVIGWTSVALLRHLLSSQKHRITCRPIYLEPSSSTTNIDKSILNSENNILDTYDTIIQHSSLESLIKIHSIPKNIAIPILNDKEMNDGIIATLSEFDQILVDTKSSYHRLQQYRSLKNKVKTYDYDILITNKPNSSFRIGVLERAKKIYFIGKYDTNIDNILNICKAFIHNVNIREYTLVLFLFDLDANKKNLIESVINKHYMLHRMNYTINRIVIAPIETELDNLLVAHQTGDIYLDLQDDHSNTLNTKIALSLDKKVVQFSYDDNEFRFDRNGRHNTMGFIGISERAINSALNHCILDNRSHDPQPFKKENILNLI